MNPFESSARERKVYRLVCELERIGSGLNDPSVLAAWAEHATDAEWASLAVLAAVRPPSAKTRQAVIQALSARLVRGAA